MLCFEENGSIGCGLIEQLSMLKTNVTRHGFKNMLLFQKNLSVLLWDDSLAALSELSEELEAPRTFSLSLLGRVCVRSKECILHIKNASSICPLLSITNMKIECGSSLSNHCLSCVVSMPHVNLQELAIIGGENAIVTFSDGIVPVLKTIGANLFGLKISKHEFVDPFFVVYYCRNLKSLKFSSNCFMDYGISNNVPRIGTLQYLEEFTFSGRDPSEALETDLRDYQLAYFLSSPKLKDITIHFCETLTDTVFEIAFLWTKFENLMYVDLSCCFSITKYGLDFLKREENSINFLFIECCFHDDDTKLLVAEWATMAKEKNWNIQTKFLSQFTEDEVVEIGVLMQVEDI